MKWLSEKGLVGQAGDIKLRGDRQPGTQQRLCTVETETHNEPGSEHSDGTISSRNIIMFAFL